MHELCEFLHKELQKLEKKVSNDQSLTPMEVEYGDKLAHFKKSLLIMEEMDDEGEYSEDGRSYAYARGGRSYAMDGGSYARGRGGRGGYSRDGSYDGGSYARGRGRNARRDSMGRYSRAEASEEMLEQLRELMREAPEEIKGDMRKLVTKMEDMG